uniref:Varv peptide A/Kalata-B1 n=2 Tax=Viola odorata TaxID=97441 RepID=VARA_VIOOD|nr:RecName: Full=Varv peptide A/Kalata-B1; AltName: Full=Cyclotide k1; Contains: RecName: Full=Varv peptide A; Contains: RecName: Full=Kalata-B1; Flags: Precursor [Viola odorata]AAU04395.1 cyclotide k1 precursor [Viola odorata]ACI29316.1 cycloviolacin O8 precursor [Viola odorata]
MKMFIVLVLSAAFALPAAFATEQDVITLQAYEELLKNGAANGMTKTVISSPVLEEALVSYSKNKLGGLPVCGETCVGGTCNTPGCSCSWPVCTRNSLESTKSANPLLEEALTAFAKKGLGGLPVCGETCVGGTCNTPGCTCSWPVCTRNALETQKPNHLLEEALVAFAKKGNLGGLPVCGETCVGGTCNTPGCSCSWPVCTRNALAM